MPPKRQYQMAGYPWWLFIRVAGHVEHGNHQAAHDDLDHVLNRMDREHGPELSPRKMRCGAILSHCLRGAYRGGAPGESILVEYMQMLDALAAKRSWKGVRKQMHVHLDSLLNHVQSQHHRDIDRLVARIRRQLRDSPELVLTLAKYAHQHHVNPDYLSRRFHQIAGQSFCAERRHFRIERAKTLLEQTSLKIRVIAQRVGIRDTSRFIREFRMITGQTAAQYRWTLGERSASEGKS